MRPGVAAKTDGLVDGPKRVSAAASFGRPRIHGGFDRVRNRYRLDGTSLASQITDHPMRRFQARIVRLKWPHADKRFLEGATTLQRACATTSRAASTSIAPN